MLGFQDKGKKTHPPGIFNSNTKPTKESNTNNRNKRCDRCRILETPCNPDLHHCKESGHQKGQSLKNSSIKPFLTTTNCIHRFETATKEHSQGPTWITSNSTNTPPWRKGKMWQNTCNHCKLTGHQTNQPQEDNPPSTWNNKDSCPFCKKGTRKTRNKITLPISSIIDDPIPPINLAHNTNSPQ